MVSASSPEDNMRRIPWIALQLASSLILGVNAYTSPCIYQSDKCGATLATLYGYSVSELIAAVNQTSSIPPISMAQLFQVIYRCEDIFGSIVGNSLCIAGCIPANSPTHDDQCQLSEATTTTTTVTVTTAAPVSCYKKCHTFCFGGSCSTSMNTMIHAPSMTPLLRF